ncbi:hypothetical protein L3Y34_006416 [Caenorhabditis briggsae]|uniref:Uncharacterized protein n=1 Tax=Caenorhabditis briggsae TaxID=6238 RepID=A0AAE9A1A6_CAEBR|nr:hypothetical protein L3Y34_006416 [Caenorhabditis briggsae]
MSYGEDQPTFEELMEVAQKQQEVIEIYEQQMDASRLECSKLTEENDKKSEIIKLMETSEILLKAEIESLRNKKEMKAETKQKPEETREDRELETIEELRLKCKELTYKLESMKTQQTSLEIELETQKKNNEFVRNELIEERKQRASEKDRLTSNYQILEQQLKQNMEEIQTKLNKSKMELGQLKTDLEMKEHREKQLERLYEDVMVEVNEIRKEKSAVVVRCSSMSAEIGELKAKNQQLKARILGNENDMEDMNKLLGDQSHLIAALREETKLLARKVEVDSREYRTTIKTLKHDKRELQQRIEALLRVD